MGYFKAYFFLKIFLRSPLFWLSLHPKLQTKATRIVVNCCQLIPKLMLFMDKLNRKIMQNFGSIFININIYAILCCIMEKYWCVWQISESRYLWLSSGDYKSCLNFSRFVRGMKSWMGSINMKWRVYQLPLYIVSFSSRSMSQFIL